MDEEETQHKQNKADLNIAERFNRSKFQLVQNAFDLPYKLRSSGVSLYFFYLTVTTTLALEITDNRT